MAQDITAIAPTTLKAPVRPLKVVAPIKAPTIAADNLAVRRPQIRPAAAKTEPKGIPSPSAAVPGEEVRNSVSLTNTVLGPLVAAKQGLHMVAQATFKSPLMSTVAQGAVKAASGLSKFLPFLKNPVFTKSLQVIGRGLPFISAGILAFDGYATIKTFINPESSGKRKALTAGRFAFNALATAISFIPGAGFIYSIPPALVGNVFEIGMAKLNASEAAKK